MTKVSPIRVPSIAALRALQREGAPIGYRGFSIYLRYRAVLEALAELAPRKVLVVGCGFGIFDRLLPAETSLLGIDLSEEAIRFAAAWAEGHRSDFRYTCGHLIDQNLESGSFDLVLLSEVLEHVPEDEIPPLMRELARVLAPGGILLLTLPNHWHPRNRARRWLRLPTVLMDPTHLREYSLHSADSLVAALPFERRAFAPAVLYLPFESQVSRVLPPESPIRRWVIRRFPQLCSHFVYVLEKTDSARQAA
jgi:SAM-dependent methyltransferase